MMRFLTVSALLLALVATVHADEPEQIKTGDLASPEVTFQRVDYMRELWVGLPGGGVNARKLLKALRESCDETTAVAVIDAGVRDDLAASESELSVLRTLAARSALASLKEELSLNPRWTRVVVVGVLESSLDAVALADHADAGIDGVVLIDPPAEDIPQVDKRAARVGVDVLLHSRSAGEFDRDEARLVKRLGEWGGSARVIRSTGHFDSIAERIAEARSHVRGYRSVEDPAVRVADIVQKWKAVSVIMVGELHGNPGAHLAQLEALKAMAAQGGKLALSTEQFERDVQEHLDAYLSGKITEEEFLRNSRPWPNYADYRPLVEFCKANGIHVIAGNIPRRLANRVFKEGVDVLEDFSEEEKSWTAAELNALPGAYKDKFMGVMGVMGGMGGHNDSLERMYAAQCIKDDTMAESIADWLKANPGGRVLHINGAFHSGGGLGVPEKLVDMMDVSIGLITCVQGDDDDAAPDEWILRVPGNRPTRQAPAGAPEHR